MFNWVCPRCGKDVPPSKTECPYCAGAPQAAPPQAPPQQYAPPAQQQWPPQPPQAPPPQAWQPPQQWQPPVPPQAPPPPPPQAAWQPPAPVPPPPQAAWQPQAPPPPPTWQPPVPEHHGHHAPWPPQKQGPPAWLVGGGVAVALLVVLGAAYYFLQPNSAKSVSADKAAGEKAAAVAPQEKAANPLQKYIEVVGIRLVTQDKKPVAKFVVVNHSTGEIAGLAANITLWASTKRSEEDSVGTFSLKGVTLGPNSSQEVTAPLTTRLKPYEMPDWQNLTAEVQITSPQP